MIARKMETCLIYRINKYLRVLEREATNHLFLVFTRKDSFDQGNALKGIICKSNQSPACCSVAVGRERDRSGINIPDDGELTKGTYHSRGKKIWWDRGEQLVLGGDDALLGSGFHSGAGSTHQYL